MTKGVHVQWKDLRVDVYLSVQIKDKSGCYGVQTKCTDKNEMWYGVQTKCCSVYRQNVVQCGRNVVRCAEEM